MSEAPIAASPLDVGVMPLEEQVASLKRGNTALIEALMDMVNQFFYHKGENGEPDEDGPILCHSFMSAEEGAISVLMHAGFAEEATDKGYRLLWDKLQQRRKDVGLAQQTWEEAVRECVTDHAEVERLLALDNDATTEEVHAAVKGHNYGGKRSDD